MTSRRSLLLGLLAALLFSISVRPWGLGALALVAFVPLFFALRQSTKVAHPIIATYTASLGITIVAFEGVAARYFTAFPILVLTQAGWFLLAGLGFWLIRGRYGRHVALLSYPFVWVACEYLPSLRLLWGINANPVMHIGYSQFGLPFMMLASIGGVLLIGLIIMVANLVAFYLLLMPKPWSILSVIPSAVIAAAGLPIVGNSPALSDQSDFPQVGIGDLTLEVGIIQGNVPNIEFVLAEYDSGLRNSILDHYGSLAAIASEPSPHVLVWPESAIPGVVDIDEPSEQLLEALRSPGATIAGAIVQDGDYRYNSALLFDHRGLSEAYRKQALVPIFESSWIEPGTTSSSILIDGTRVGLAICLDTVVPELFREAALGGAELFIALTSSTFAGPTSTPELHLRVTAFRAVEYQRPIVFASQSGPSGVIGADGKIALRTRQGESAILLASIVPESSISLYARLGNWAGWLSLIVSTAFVAGHVLVGVIRSKLATGEIKPSRL